MIHWNIDLIANAAVGAYVGLLALGLSVAPICWLLDALRNQAKKDKRFESKEFADHA